MNEKQNDKNFSLSGILIIIGFLFFLFFVVYPPETSEKFSIPENQQIQQQIIKYTKVNLNLRGFGGKGIIDVFQKGTKVLVISDDGEWSQVKVNSQQGWMATKYLETEVEKNVRESKEIVYYSSPTNSKIEELEQKIEELEKKQELEKLKSLEKELEASKKELEQLEQMKNIVEQIQAQPKIDPLFQKQGYETQEVVKFQGKYVVGVACFNSNGDLTTGSGVIIGENEKHSTIVLTNYHIVEYAYPYYSTLNYPCMVALSSDPTTKFTDFYSAQPIYFPDTIPESIMKIKDFYFLAVKEKLDMSDWDPKIISNASLSLIDTLPRICDKSEIEIGKEIVVLGYPTIGGDYLTATEGIVGGFDGEYYFTTSAKIEKGNSGGGAFLKSSGCFAGMPTFVMVGEIESLARLINMPYLKEKWLSKIWDY